MDYTGEASSFEINKAVLGQGERILLIDDWAETGGQLRGLTKLLENAAQWYPAFRSLVSIPREHRASYAMPTHWQVFLTTTRRINAT